MSGNEKKQAILVLNRDLQERFLNGNLSKILDPCMSLAMCGMNAVCKCMDGRTNVGRHLAGSGILLWHRLGEERALHIMKSMGFFGICTHEDCGALKIVAEERGLFENPDELGTWWGNHVSNMLGIINYGHLEVRHDFHPETVVVLDGTGRGHWTSTGLPDRMVINAKYPSPEYVAEELSIAIRIIFGPSGMGEFLTPNFPLIVLAVGDPRSGGRVVGGLTVLAQEVVSASGYGDRVAVLSYTPPIESFPG